jgi:hypothetical protein
MASGEQSTLTPERAREVNALTVRAWMVQQGLHDGPVPSLRGVTLDDAVAASRMMAGGLGRERRADGGTTLHCHVDETRIPRLYAWAILQAEDTTYGKR